MIRFQDRNNINLRRTQIEPIIHQSPSKNIDDIVSKYINIEKDTKDFLHHDIFIINITLNHDIIPFIDTLSGMDVSYYIIYNLLDYISNNLKPDLYFVILNITINEHISTNISTFINNILFYLRPRQINITQLNYDGTIILSNIFGDPMNNINFGLRDCLSGRIVTSIDIHTNNDFVTMLYKNFFEKFDVPTHITITIKEHDEYKHIDYPLHNDSEIFWKN